MSTAPSRGSFLIPHCAAQGKPPVPTHIAAQRSPFHPSASCLPPLKSSLQWLTFRGEQAACQREEDGWERLISEGVGRAQHDSTMETAGAALAAAAGLRTHTPGIINMQAASRCRGAANSILPCSASREQERRWRLACL